MHVRSFRVENFRRLKNVVVNLDQETTILVGANNSGKTSATHVFQRFLDPKANFQIYDFTADCWDVFNRFDPATTGNADVDLPKISFDLWFEVDDANVHRVVNLLPGLDWNDEPVGVRMVYAPRDGASLIASYQQARAAAKPLKEKADSNYKPWPQNLTDYLSKRLSYEYEIKYYMLDARQCDDNLVPKPGYEPFELSSTASGESSGRAIVNRLIRVDFLNAQRHLTDESHGRAEDLSHRLSRYYQRNLPKFEAELDTLSAIADSETALNKHYADAFDSLLTSIEKLGYPGSHNPGLVVKASLNARDVLSTSARVHYALPDGSGGAPADSAFTLPDQYNGLGFKNLIYMAVEIRDFHFAWAEADGERPPVHLIMIEEPEAHLHAQLQQVFINRVSELLPAPEPGFGTQMVVTTHSSHVLYERSFDPIRYFCRSGQAGPAHCSDVKNLSAFYQAQEGATLKFLQRYLKLTHCDLFFADAAVLVEGNVERLLLPLIIQREVPELRACHLTILEVGGAFAHIFQELLEFLEISTLVITDLDSVAPAQEGDASDDEDSDGGKACLTTIPDAVTSNETLKQWFPKQVSIDDLLNMEDEDKFVDTKDGIASRIRVAYQTRRPTKWGKDSAELAGRTLEEAFALENLDWTQSPERRRTIKLFIPKSEQLTLESLHDKIFNRVRSNSFDKTQFALGLIADQDNSWAAPRYIVEGLEWLRGELGIQPTPPARPEADAGVTK